MFARRILILLLAMTAAAFGQSTNGTLTGIITDPSDAAIAGAKVAVRNQATGIVKRTETTTAGVYTVPLPPAMYEITVEMPGFRALVRPGIEINVNQTSRLDLRLEVGQVSDRVTVEGAAPLVQSETSELGMVMNSKAVIDMPLSTPGQRRMVDTFTLLAPGVTTGGGSGGSYANQQWDRGGQWQVNGSQENSREILYDGVSTGKIHSPGRIWAESPSPDSVQEFKMLTGTYSAEFGRAAGGVLSLTTRSGTNDFHGSAYEFLKNDKLHARGFFTPTKAKDRQNEYGLTFGGPVLVPKLYDGRNKTFFYFFYNAMRWRTASANELVTVAPPEFLRGDFTNFLGPDGKQRPIYDPQTNSSGGAGIVVRQQFPGNIIPAHRISKVSAAIAALLPQPMFNRQTQNFVGVRTTSSDDDRWQIKIDHSISDKQKFTALYNEGEFVRFGNGPLPQEFFSGFTTRDEPAKMIRLSHDYIFGPTVINHFAAGFNRDPEDTRVPSAGQGWGNTLGLTGTGDPAGAFPRVNFGSEADYNVALGGEANAIAVENSFVFSDSVTIIRGAHSLKLGGDYRRYQYNARVFHRNHGTFNFSTAETNLPNSTLSPVTGSAIASFLLGAVNNATSFFPGSELGLRFRYISGFLQDDWKVTRRLTLNLGFRYEIAVPFNEVADRMSVFDPAAPNPAAGGRLGALVFAGSGPGRSGRSRFASTDWKNFGPRVGLAWQALSNTVVRAGYGIFYGMAGAAAENEIGTNVQLGFNAQPQFTVVQNGEPAFYWDNGFPQNFIRPPVVDPSFANNQDIRNYIRPEDGRPPYIQNWQIGIQRQLGQSFVVEAAYVGSKGTRLASQNLRPNQLHPDYLKYGDLLNANITSQAARDAGFTLPYPGFTGTVAQALRPFPQYRTVALPSETLGNSTYNSLQLQARKRYSHGLQLSVAYTLSKKLTDSGESQVQAQNGGPMDTYNLRLEKSVSYDDPRHVLATGFSYELPFGRGKALLNFDNPIANAVIGGWQLSGMLRYQGGFPLRIGGGFGLPIFSGNRPTYTGQPIRTTVSVGDFDPGRDVWLNRAAFSNGDRFAFGNVPRTVPARGFPFYDENVGLLKNFYVRERLRIEYRAEFYNVLNRVNFGPPVTDSNSVNFGKVASQLGNPRQAQMGLRLSF
jgi:hypothetical protein